MEFGNSKKIYIFGAHSRSQTLGVYLKALFPDISIQAYLVDNDEENPKSIEGVQVVHLNQFTERDLVLDGSCPVYIGTRGIYHDVITAHLQRLGIRKIIPITVEMDQELRNRYVKREFEKKNRVFRKLSDDWEVATSYIYVVRSIHDKHMDSVWELRPWERFIQVGCECENERVKDIAVFDNDGENISARNRQFCELTALYWIWKNSREDIVGLEHYRRHFLLDNDWLDKMRIKNIDVVLPVPLYVRPSLAENYRQRHTDCTWNSMMDILRRNPEEYIQAQEFFECTGCYSPCNMLIAKKSVLDDLCKWMFPIIFEVAGRIGEIDDAYQNRYPGFLSERLITFFFYEHREQYKVVYADKNFLR